jgi:hypothetical protein
MSNLFAGLLAGAVGGVGDAVVDVYKRRDTFDLQSQLEEQRAKADFDRQQRLEEMRGAREQVVLDKRLEAEGQWRGEDRAVRQEDLQERRADRVATREERKTERQEARDQRVEDRDLAMQDRREARGSAAAERAAARADAKDYRDAMVGLRREEMGLKGEKMPPQVQASMKSLDAEADDLRDREKEAQKALLGTDATSDVKLKERIDAELSGIKKAKAQVEVRRFATLAEHGYVKPEKYAEKAAKEGFGSLEEIDTFERDAARISPEFGDKVRSRFEELDVRSKVPKPNLRSQEGGGAGYGSAPPPTPKTGVASLPGLLSGAGETLSSMMPNSTARVGRASQGGGSAPTSGAPEVALGRLSPSTIRSMDATALQDLLARGDDLTPIQRNAAMSRLQELRGR